MAAADPTAVVIVFARAPLPGAAKSRLIPLLGAEGAAAFHVRLVEHTLVTACEAAPHRVELHCAPDADHQFFQFCARRHGIDLEAQAGSDLGARMLSAFERALRQHACALLIGSDCPALTTHHVRQAQRVLLDGNDAVFVPCEDGGYALIGLTRADPRLFDGIAWGTADVMAETRVRLRQLGWSWHELETLWDVDRPEDYARLMDSGLLESRRATA